MIKKIGLLLSTIFFFVSTYSQSLQDSVKWMSMDSVSSKFKKIPKPIFIYFYANDCDSCRHIEQTTFSNPEVANYINVLFYPVKLNAYSHDTLQFFDGNYFGNSPKTGIQHDLAYTLTGGNDTLPAIVIFSRRAKGQAFTGYMNRDQIFRPLIYYAEDIDRWTDYPDWKELHTSAFPPGQEQVVTRLNIRWRTLDEYKELNKKQARKLLLTFYNYNRISGTVMRTRVYNHPEVAEYLNRKYYPVSIDVFTQDTISLRGVDYVNENKDYKFHQLPIAALQGKMTFPAFVILDEEGNVLDRIQKFLSPEELLLILKFYGDDIYKKKSWEEYLQNQ